jgi:hypothetical protein
MVGVEGRQPLDRLEAAVQAVSGAGAIPIVLGGDHTITWPDATGVARARGIAVELPVVGMDVVEVSPPYDHADVTAYLANRVVLDPGFPSGYGDGIGDQPAGLSSVCGLGLKSGEERGIAGDLLGPGHLDGGGGGLERDSVVIEDPEADAGYRVALGVGGNDADGDERQAHQFEQVGQLLNVLLAGAPAGVQRLFAQHDNDVFGRRESDRGAFGFHRDGGVGVIGRVVRKVVVRR